VENSPTEIDGLIGQLSLWERDHGVRFSGDPRLASSGESNAAIAELKRRLDTLGARYHWHSSRREYVLDSVGDAPGGEGEPE
jgi:hypothetical protein